MPNLAVGQRGEVMGLTSGAGWKHLPPLGVHVSVVIENCSQKQMVGPDASGIVATVADECSRWDRAIVNLPRNARSYKHAPLHPRACRDHAVASMLGSRPEPTRLRLVDLFPESFSKGAGGILPGHREPPTRGVTLPVVDAAREHFASQFYTVEAACT